MRLALSFALTALVALPADAGPFRHRRAHTVTSSSCQSSTFNSRSSTTSSCGPNGCTLSTLKTTEFSKTTTTSATTSASSTTISSTSALDEVNAKRAARGLRPFQHDPLLTIAAEACAAHRAQHRLFGHSANDFQFLPAGAKANAAGCAAYPASYGFMACCVYDSYTFAGAASVTGPDGRVYHHLFVR